MHNSESVFKRVLADSFDALSITVQRIHDNRAKQLHGRCDVQRGSHWLVCWLASIASLPPTAMDTPLSVTIDTDPHGETWTRDFNGHCMQSRLWAKSALLAERLGAITLLFTLCVDQGRLKWHVAGARLLGLPLPMSWFVGACATEQIIDGRYTFDVRATLPRVGLLIHYHGWLAE